jgi:hypothetical protein
MKFFVKLFFVAIGLLSMSGAVFAQSKPIFGYSDVSIGMDVAAFLRLYRGASENDNSGLPNVKIFTLGQMNNIHLSEFYFYQNKLFRIVLTFDTNEYPIASFINNIKNNYGNFDSEKEEFENMGQMRRRVVTCQRDYNRNFTITILIQEMYMGNSLIQQLYLCDYYNPIIAGLVKKPQ